MRGRKLLISLGIIVLILVLGVGYAVVNTVNITLGGTATVGDAPIKVTIYNVHSTTTGNAIINHTWTGENDTTDTFSISNMSLNEQVTIKYTIKNYETDVTSTISEIGNITNSNTEYFEVVRTNSISEIKPGQTGEVTIVVKLKKTPINESEGTATISYTLKATPKSY